MVWAVNIVGGSVAGLALAKNLAENGWPVRVIEEHDKIGLPLQCSGLVSDSGVKRSGLDIEGLKINSVRGAEIHSPSGLKIKVAKRDPVAYVVDRAGLDQKLAKKAKAKGAEILTGAKVISLKGENLFIKHASGKGEMMKGKYLVGADGPNSFVRKELAYKQPKESRNFVAIHGRIEGSFDPEFVQLHFGPFAPKFFAWVIPNSKTEAKIGLATPIGTNLNDSLKQFMQARLELKPSDVTNLGGGMIPIGPPLPELVKGNSLLLGDSAFMTKATTGGGILNSHHAASFAARVIEKNHAGQSNSLKEYESLCKRELYPDLNLHWKIMKHFQSKSYSEIDSLFEKAHKSGLGEFLSEHGDMDRPTLFWDKLKGVKFWRLMPELLKIGLS